MISQEYYLLLYLQCTTGFELKIHHQVHHTYSVNSNNC
jgi:hypothetical protein